MKPEVDVVLGGFLGTLLTEIAPQLGAEYSLGSVGLIAMTVGMAAQEFDRAADLRVAENREMRALFSEAAKLVGDRGLAARLKEAAASQDGSFRVSALNATNDELAKLLIELQAHVEESKADWAAPFEAKLWDYIVGAAERRRVVLPTFG
ncbi:MAG: hypothetical protein WBG82_11315 [Parvibaculum sp.]|uniref:hypothetical protein n=1 Tax=Parvibaculum sp. TaxID=2024848 RepID=UPI003C769B84